MSFWSFFRPACMLLLTITFLTGILYPLFITSIAQWTMPDRANGSLLFNNGKVVGSSLIGQGFKKEEYFHPRPSAVDFDPIKPAGGSNLGPTSKKLQAIVNQRMKQLPSSPPSELVYASGSGLDPHLSLAAIYYQIDRVAKARNIENTQQLYFLVDSLKEGFLHSYVNVLLLNQSLDYQFPMKN